MPSTQKTGSPAVSVVIPMFNQKPGYLREAIRSALDQSFGDLEVVVSDNHSTNEAPAVIGEFADPRLRVVRPPEHLPLNAHFGFAGEQARGRFISFLASDDLVAPRWLERLLPMFEQYPEATYGFGEIENVPADDLGHINYHARNLALPTGYYPAEKVMAMMMRMDRAAGWMVGDLIRADAYRRVGGIAWGNIRYCGDYGLSLRLLEVGGGAVYLNEVVAKNRVWVTQDGKADVRRMRAAAADIAEIFEMLAANPALQPLVRRLRDELATARANKARMLTLLLLAAIARDEIDEASIVATRADILRIDHGRALNRLLLGLCRPGLAGLLRGLHDPAFRFARSRFGRTLLRL